MTLTYNIMIVIWAIRVGGKYYSFKYKVFLNNKIHIKESVYDGDHSHGHEGVKEFRKTLKNGWAAELVLGNINPSKPKQIENKK